MDDVRSCLLFSTADWDTPYWTNKQHMAVSLAKKGFRVLYIESVGLRRPGVNRKDIKRIFRRLKRGLAKPREASKGIYILSPLSIPFKHHWGIVRALNQGILKWRIRSFMKEHHFRKPLIWTYHPFVLETLEGLTTGPLVYHCVDDLSQVPGIDKEKFREEEKRLVSNCNVVFTTSESLKKSLGNESKVKYLSNVVDLEHFGQARRPGPLPDDMSTIPTPRLGFIGALSDYKVNFDLVLDIAKTEPGWQWIFIGEEREGQSNPLMAQLRSLTNCHFLGYKSYQELPGYMRGLDVGLLPSLINDYTRGMFPMKYFEYLAAGLPVVSTALEFTKSTSNGLLVAKDSESFVQAIKLQLGRGHLTDEESVQFVGDNTWEGRLEKMLDLIGADL